MSTDYLWTEDELTSFEIENRFNDSTITFIIVSKDIPTCLTKLLQFIDPWIKSYPWMTQPPLISQQQTTYNNLTIDYIYGELNYHEYIPESLLLVSLLFQFSKYHKDAYIHFFDSLDIEPLLIHCHDFLSNDLQEVLTSINRAWIHDYSIIILNLHDDRYINLYIAIQQLNNLDYIFNSSMTEYWRIKTKFEEYLSNIHDIKIDDIPIDIAKLITNDSSLISLGLISLEDESRLNKIEFENENENNDVGNLKTSVNTPINTMNLGIIFAICKNRPDLKPKDVIINGLFKYYNDKLKKSPIIPSNIQHKTRYDLQHELINRGLINELVEENKDVYEIFTLEFDEDEDEEEETLASQLHGILNNAQNILDEDEDDDPDYDEFSGDEELLEFREKYYEVTDVWLDKEHTINLYNKFKNLMMDQVESFKLDFKNSEFDDFPEFIETDIILGIEQEEKEEERKKEFKTGEYQGDMNYDEYMKFKKNLRKQGNLIEDSDNEDSDWEDIIDADEEEEEEGSMDDESVGNQVDYDDDADDEFAYHQTTPLSGSPKIREITEPELDEPQIVELSENLKNLQTDNTGKSTKTLEDILIQRYSKK